MQDHRERVLNAMARFQAGVGAGDEERVRADLARASRAKQRPKDAAPTEYREQCLFVDWLKAHGIAYAANLEGMYHGDPVRGAVMRRAGAKKGRPDIEIFTRCPKYPDARGVAVEMKSTRTGARATPEQLGWLAKLSECGWVTYVAQGGADAIEFAESLGYGVPV